MVGWGLDENENTAEDLKVAKLPVVSSEACLRSFPQFYSQFTSNGTFCAGFRNGKSIFTLLYYVRRITYDIFQATSTRKSNPKSCTYTCTDVQYGDNFQIAGTSPCNGDSGGGMVFNRNSIWYLRGVVSLSVAKEGLNFCDPRYYVTFTDLAKFRDFIDKYA